MKTMIEVGEDLSDRFLLFLLLRKMHMHVHGFYILHT
jgi:hypothetical protein